MTTRCITRLAKDLDCSWFEHFCSIQSANDMAGGFEREPFAALLDVDGRSTPGSAKSYCSIDEEGPLDESHRGPWHLEMAPLSSITPDENNQYYPGRTKRVEKKIDVSANGSGYKAWRQSAATPKALRSLSVSDSSAMGMMASKSRTRLVSVPILSEIIPAQDHGFDQEEESSLFAAIFPETEPLPPSWRNPASCKLAPAVTVPSTMQATSRPVTEGFGALNNGPAIRNVLDFSLQDYYGGFSELMSGLSVSSSASSSPKPADPEPSAKTHTVSAMFLDTGDAGCCSSEKKSPEAGKTEYHDLDSYVPSTYSRKVFIGGLPPDLDADDIKRHFIQFGDLLVDWPHKARTRALFPPKGYAFLLFRQEVAIHRLLQACLQQDGKFFVFLSSTSLKDKKVQVRPWFIADSEYKHHPGQGPDPRKTVFIGGVPRPMRACELADIMNERFGHVSYAAIDLDTDVNYPKGAGRVSFTSTNSFISAVSSRFFQMTYGDVNKGVEVKPYVMDDQMCDECHGVQCNGKFAPFYCGSVSCLQYYCEHCWATVHALPSKQLHRPLTKDTGDRPRAMPFRGHFN